MSEAADQESRPSRWRRSRPWRVALVLLLLLGGLVLAGLKGAQLLWEDAPERAAPVTCWDGTTAPLPDCAEPAGVAGLQWVFPRFRPQDEESRCRRVRYPDADGRRRPLEFTCPASIDGDDVTLVYSRRTDTQVGLAFLHRRYGVDPTRLRGGGRLLFRGPEAQNGVFSATLAYADHPFSVRVDAATRSLRETALDRLVVMRPVEQVLARPGPLA